MDTTNYELLRDVSMHVGATRHFRLQLWDTLRSDYSCGRARTVLAYRLTRYATGATIGEVIFEGADFRCSALHSDDSDETLRSLLTFLTLQRGDTDADYFEDYSDEQRAFRDSDDCSALQLWASCSEHDDCPAESFVENDLLATEGGAL